MAEETQGFLEGLGFKQEETFAPPLIATEAQVKNAVEANAGEQQGFWGSLPTAAREEWILPTVIESIDRFKTFDEAPVDEFTPDIVSQLTADITDTRAAEEILMEASSSGMRSAMATREVHLTTQRRRAELAKEGMSGTLATAAAAFLDPVEWSVIGGSTAAIVALSGPAAPITGPATAVVGAARQAKKGFSVGRAALAGAGVTAAELGAFESIRAGLKYDIEANDVLMVMGAGAALGGALNAATMAFVKRGNLSRLAKVVAEGGELTPAQRTFYEANNGEALATRLIERELSSESFMQAVHTDDYAKAVGDLEAEAAFRALPTTEVSVEAAGEAAPKMAGWSMFGLREIISTGARMGSSAANYSRLVGGKLGMNSAGFVDPTIKTPFSASEKAERLQSAYRASYAYAYLHNSLLWRKTTGGQLPEFNTLVSRYVRGITTDVPAEVKAVGDLVKEQELKMATEAVDSDVAGFSMDILNRHKNYLPRLFSEERIVEKMRQLGPDAQDKITDLVETAIRNGQPDLVSDVTKVLTKRSKTGKTTPKAVEAYIRKIAAGYTRSITDPKVSMNRGPAGSNEMNLEDIADVMKLEGFGEDEIDGIVDILTRRGNVKGHKRTRFRIVLDESASISVTRADGQLEELHFYDLLEEDIDTLHNAYIFQLSGAIGLAKNGINTNKAGSTFEDWLDLMKKEYRDKPELDRNNLQKEINAAQFMFDGITGRLAQRQEVSNKAREFHIGARAFSFSVNMGMSGMSSLMEISNSVFEYSLRTNLKTNKALNQLYLKAKDGKLPDSLMRELVEDIGLGSEVATGKFAVGTRYEADNIDGYIGPVQKGLGKGLQKTQQFVSYWSGLLGVTQTLRRKSMQNLAYDLAYAAKDNKQIYTDIKLSQMGLDRQSLNAINEEIRNNAIFEGDKLVSLNKNQWNPTLRELFDDAMFKNTRQSVQELNIGSTNRTLRGENGKSFFQFLSYTLGSVEQQSQRMGVRAVNGDGAAVSKVMLSASFMGMMMYMARVQMNAVGRSDADEYIQKRMEWDNFVVGSLSQIGAASIFSYIYQITTGAMDGNTHAITPPIISMAQTLLQFSRAFENGEISEAEYRRVLRLLPAQSLYGARQILNKVANEAAN